MGRAVGSRRTGADLQSVGGAGRAGQLHAVPVAPARRQRDGVIAVDCVAGAVSQNDLQRGGRLLLGLLRVGGACVVVDDLDVDLLGGGGGHAPGGVAGGAPSDIVTAAAHILGLRQLEGEAGVDVAEMGLPAPVEVALVAAHLAAAVDVAALLHQLRGRRFLAGDGAVGLQRGDGDRLLVLAVQVAGDLLELVAVVPLGVEVLIVIAHRNHGARHIEHLPVTVRHPQTQRAVARPPRLGAAAERDRHLRLGPLVHLQTGGAEGEAHKPRPRRDPRMPPGAGYALSPIVGRAALRRDTGLSLSRLRRHHRVRRYREQRHCQQRQHAAAGRRNAPPTPTAQGGGGGPGSCQLR